jgi:hypothetical protein
VSFTSDPVNSKIENGWNFLVLGGAIFSTGKLRANFLGVSPWERGWISRFPQIEFGASYAPNSDWEFGLQVPLLIVSTTINAYYRINDFVKVGMKVGYLSTLSSTFSVYPMQDWFISLTPSISFVRFGFPPSKHTNETLVQSRMTVNGQFAFGRHVDPLDLAFLIGYSYAMGEQGVENSIIFDDTLMRHFVKADIALVF